MVSDSKKMPGLKYVEAKAKDLLQTTQNETLAADGVYVRESKTTPLDINLNTRLLSPAAGSFDPCLGWEL